MAVTRRDLIDYMKAMFNTNNVVVLDEFETRRTRHICHGFNEISILGMGTANVTLPDYSAVNVNYFFCRRCGKLFLEKNSLTVSRATPVNPNAYQGYSNVVSGGYDPVNPLGIYPQANPFYGTCNMGRPPVLFEDVDEFGNPLLPGDFFNF